MSKNLHTHERETDLMPGLHSSFHNGFSFSRKPLSLLEPTREKKWVPFSNSKRPLANSSEFQDYPSGTHSKRGGYSSLLDRDFLLSSDHPFESAFSDSFKRLEPESTFTFGKSRNHHEFEETMRAGREIAELEVSRLSDELASKTQALSIISEQLIQTKKALAEWEIHKSSCKENMLQSLDQAKREAQAECQREIAQLKKEHLGIMQKNASEFEALEMQKNAEINKSHSEIIELRAYIMKIEDQFQAKAKVEKAKAEEHSKLKEKEIEGLKANMEELEKHIQTKIREEFAKKNEIIREMEEEIRSLKEGQENNKVLNERLLEIKEELEQKIRENEKLRLLLNEATNKQEDFEKLKERLEEEKTEYKIQAETSSEIIRKLRSQIKEKEESRRSGGVEMRINPGGRTELPLEYYGRDHYAFSCEPNAFQRPKTVKSLRESSYSFRSHKRDMDDSEERSKLALAQENEILKASLHNYTSKLRSMSSLE